MKAVLFYGPQDIRYEETRIKPLEKGEILVKIEAALTCGTDVNKKKSLAESYEKQRKTKREANIKD